MSKQDIRQAAIEAIEQRTGQRPFATELAKSIGDNLIVTARGSLKAGSEYAYARMGTDGSVRFVGAL